MVFSVLNPLVIPFAWVYFTIDSSESVADIYRFPSTLIAIRVAVVRNQVGPFLHVLIRDEVLTKAMVVTTRVCEDL